MNDVSARGLQMKEMKLNLGPAKGKDFASSFGPYMVTPDELDETSQSDADKQSTPSWSISIRIILPFVEALDILSYEDGIETLPSPSVITEFLAYTAFIVPVYVASTSPRVIMLGDAELEQEPAT